MKPIADSIDGEEQENAYDAGFSDGQREMAFKILKDLDDIYMSIEKDEKKTLKMSQNVTPCHLNVTPVR